MSYLELDNIIENVQKFGGATTYWHEITSRLPKFVPGDIVTTSGSKFARLFSPKSSAKVFHSSHFRVSSSRNTRNVTTIHDLIYEKGLGGGRGRLLNLYERRKSVARADAIICISESTRRDLYECYGSLVKDKPVFVIHHGCTRLPAAPTGPSALVQPQYAAHGLVDGDFFIFVGGRGGYKNFNLLLDAFDIGSFARQGQRLVCTGAPFSPAEQSQIEERGLTGKVLAIGLVAPAVLGELYGVATALVYPSAYEGFGLPPLEAMAAGCPVICANSSSLPEVVGDSGLLIDPRSAEQLASAMQTMLDTERRQFFVGAGKLRATIFDWNTSARAHADVYQSIAPF